MNSAHFRSASATERRSTFTNGMPSRINSTRVRDYEHPRVQENGSPVLSDHGFDHENGSTVNNYATERRRERYTVTNTETYTTRTRKSPVKDSFSEDDPLTRRKNIHSPSTKRHFEREVKQETRPWAPETKLIPYSSAPLAVRITFPVLRRDAPDVLDPPSLLHMTMAQQEEALLDDLLYVFMGFEGQYISFVDGYNPAEEKDRLLGPAWKISYGLDPSLKDLIESVLLMASHYSALEAFVEIQSREEYGSVNHALCATIRRLLKDYLILVAQLESKITGDSNFTLHQMHLSIMPTAQSLVQLYAVAQELLKRNALLADDLEESIDDLEADKIIERLNQGGDVLLGSMVKKKCIGGKVLSLLTQRLATYRGDPAAKSILEMLLREASRPYMIMLNEWLHHGGIKDPHDEFLIGERKSIKREKLDEDYTDEYWEKRYFIREDDIPPQLQAVKDKVLLAGKYLNVVRECGGVNVTSKMHDTPTSFDDPRFLDNVNHAYSFANQELLSLMLAKNSLRGRLQSIKHYFFLDRAEFFLYFLELSASELRKPQRTVNVGKLQSLLDLVIHQPGSIAVNDPYKEDVKIKINDLGLVAWLMQIVNVQGMDSDNPETHAIEQEKIPASVAMGNKDESKDISGYEGLELDYLVPFPLSLIISRKTIIFYQLILRYTLSLRRLESSLIESWFDHNKTISWVHKSSSKRVEIFKRRAWNLRARMLVFVQQMLFYATAEVLEPQWQKFMAKVNLLESDTPPSSSHHNKPPPRNNATTLPPNPTTPPSTRQTVDELMQTHLDMLSSCMKDLGLTQSKLLRIHGKMVQSCTMFSQYTANLTRTLFSADADFAALTSSTPSSSASSKKQQQQQREKILASYHNHVTAGGTGGTGAGSANTANVPAAPAAAGLEHDEARLARIEETLARYEEFFNRHLRILIDTLNYYAATETVTLLGLCARLTNAEVQQRRDDLGSTGVTGAGAGGGEGGYGI